MAASDDVNPFLTPSTLPFGMPPFAQIRDEHYREAFELGMAQQLDEVALLDRARIGFECDFDIVGKTQTLAQTMKERVITSG